MKISGSGKQRFDHDLLARLAQKSESGNTISKAEAKEQIGKSVNDLRDKFLDKGNTTGLKADAQAVANTFRKAINSGWVRSASTKALINEFISGSDAESLSSNVSELRQDVRDENPVRRNVGYSRSGGSASRPSYRAPTRSTGT